MIVGMIIFFQALYVSLIFGLSYILNLEATKMITTTILTTATTAATMKLFDYYQQQQRINNALCFDGLCFAAGVSRFHALHPHW